MATIYVSEAEAIRDIAGLLARAQQGEEIVIQKEAAAP
jgi:antitoxin (DNA-binding transcriptional repressor) of toxin-antitoxin stability system